MQNVPEFSRMHAECIPESPECMKNISEYSRMHAKCSRIFQNACRMFQNVPECMQICELKCSHISLHAVTKAFMQLCKLVYSSFLCLSSSQEFRSACFGQNMVKYPHKGKDTALLTIARKKSVKKPKTVEYRTSISSFVYIFFRLAQAYLWTQKKGFYQSCTLKFLQETKHFFLPIAERV